MSTYSVSDLLHKTVQCNCGRTHGSVVQHVVIRENAMDCLPELMAQHGYKKAYIICDVNTWDAAAKQVNDILRAAGCSTIVCKLQDKELVPDEKALGYVTMQYDPSCDVIVGVESQPVLNCDDLSDLLEQLQPGQTVKLQVYRRQLEQEMDMIVIIPEDCV